jgi:hypothetical protein
MNLDINSEQLAEYRDQKSQNYILPHLLEGLVRYANHRVAPGGFLTKCLENNFTEALFKADLESERCLRGIDIFINNVLPRSAWGSKQKVSLWSANLPREDYVSVSIFVRLDAKLHKDVKPMGVRLTHESSIELIDWVGNGILGVVQNSEVEHAEVAVASAT